MSSDGRIVISTKPWLQSAHGIRQTQPRVQGPRVLQRIPAGSEIAGKPWTRLKHAGGMHVVGHDPRHMTLRNAAGTTSTKGDPFPMQCAPGQDSTLITTPWGQQESVSCDIWNPTLPGPYTPGNEAQLEVDAFQATNLADIYSKLGNGFSQASQVLRGNALALDCLAQTIQSVNSGQPVENPSPTCSTVPVQCDTASYSVQFNIPCDSACPDSSCLSALQAGAKRYDTQVQQLLNATALDVQSAMAQNPKTLAPPLSARDLELIIAKNPEAADQLEVQNTFAVGDNVQLVTLIQFIDSLLYQFEHTPAQHTQATGFMQDAQIFQNGNLSSLADWFQSVGGSQAALKWASYAIENPRKIFWEWIISPGVLNSTAAQAILQEFFACFINGVLPTELGYPLQSPPAALYSQFNQSDGQWNAMGERWNFIAFMMVWLEAHTLAAGAIFVPPNDMPAWVLKNQRFDPSDIDTLPSAWTFGVWGGGYTTPGGFCFPPNCDSATAGTAIWSDKANERYKTHHTPLPPVPPDARTLLLLGVGGLIAYLAIARYGFPQITAS